MRPDPYAWNGHPEVLAAVALLAAAYLVALRRFRAPGWRMACFAGGVALLVGTAVTPLDSLTYHLLWAHLLQNVVLAEWAPALLVLGLPPALAARLARPRPLRLLTFPLVALPLWLGNYFAWHLPRAYDAALENPALLHLEHASYVATGILLWWPVLHDEPWRLGDALRSVYVVGAFVLSSPLGLLLALLPQPVYGYYAEGPRAFALSPLADQQIAGITMSFEEALLFFAAFLVFFLRFIRNEERGGALEAAQPQ